MAHRVEGGRELRSTAARIVVLDVHHLGGQVDVGARNARHRLDRTPDSFPGGMRAVAFVERSVVRFVVMQVSSRAHQAMRRWLSPTCTSWLKTG